MKKALVIGVDHYQRFGDLGGCANDAKAVSDRLRRHTDGSANFQVFDEPPGEIGRDRLKAMLGKCFLEGAADVALFYFAGHGSPRDGQSVELCTTDGTDQTPGVDFTDVLEMVAESKSRQKVVILDCCYSGGGGGLPALNIDGAFLPPGTTLLSASRGDEAAMEAAGGGIFTGYLTAALDGAAGDLRGRVTAAGLYAYLDECFGAIDQRPQFKANVDGLTELRRCAPRIADDDLRTMAEMFPDPNITFDLDPSYEPELDPHHAEHERLFTVLQTGRASRLVDPVSEEHLYFEALNNGAVVLTPLGRHYVSLVHRGLL